MTNTPEEKKDIFVRFPFLSNENLQKFSYVSEDEVTDNMEVIGKDTYNDTDLLLVREYVSPIQTARELYDESYQMYQDAVSEKMENGTYEKFLEEHRKELKDDDSETVYHSPEILYKWWADEKDPATEKDITDGRKDHDLAVLDNILGNGRECNFHINFLKFGKGSDDKDLLNNYYSLDSAGAKKFVEEYGVCNDFESNVGYNDNTANKILDIMKRKGLGTEITVELTRNERCSDWYDVEKGGDDKEDGKTLTDKDGDKGVHIASITLGTNAPHNLTISGYDMYLQVPSGKKNYTPDQNDRNDYCNIYADENGNPNKIGDKYYYTHDVAIIDFCYKVPANYVPSHADVTCLKYGGARFSTKTYNYQKKIAENGRLAFNENDWAGKSTLGFLWEEKYQNDITNSTSKINTSNELRHGATQSISKVTNKNKTTANLEQVDFSSEVGDYYKKNGTDKFDGDNNKNLDNFTLQINLHENTAQGLSRTSGEVMEKVNSASNNANSFYKDALKKFDNNDKGAILYIVLAQNTESLRFDLGIESKYTKNKWVNTANNNAIYDDEIQIPESNAAAHGTRISLEGTTGSTASVSDFDKYRLVGHKLRYVKVQRSVHPSSDQPKAVFDKLPSSEFKANDDKKFSTKNVFSWGMGGFHLGGYLSAGKATDSNNDGIPDAIMNEGVWKRTIVRGEDAIDTSYISYPEGNEVKKEYTFMNQNYQVMENPAKNDLYFYYNNSTPKIRVVQSGVENTVANAASVGHGPDLEDEDTVKTAIIAECYRNILVDSTLTANEKKKKLIKKFKENNTSAAIIDYKKEDGEMAVYTLCVTTSSKDNPINHLHEWMKDTGFAVYDTEDYENSINSNLHKKIPQIGNYKIKKSNDDDIREKSEKSETNSNGIVSNQLYWINKSGNLDGEKINKYSIKKNGDYQDVEPTKITLMCRDRSIDGNNASDLKHNSIKKVKILLYFVGGTLPGGTTVDTSHKFKVNDVKDVLNPSTTTISGFNKIKSFTLTKPDPDNVGQFKTVTHDDLPSFDKFFGHRLIIGTYTFDSKITYTHKRKTHNGWLCVHAYDHDTTVSGNKCKCGHGHGKHINFDENGTTQTHCLKCHDPSRSTHPTLTHDPFTKQVVINVVNDPPSIFTENYFLTEDDVVNSGIFYLDGMLEAESISDQQDTNIHDGDSDTITKHYCEGCRNGGNYTLSYDASRWGTDPNTGTPTNTYTQELYDQGLFSIVVNSSIIRDQNNKGGTNSSGDPWCYPNTFMITDRDGATTTADNTNGGNLYIYPTLHTSVKYKTLTFHTNESISPDDLLNNVTATTGYGDAGIKSIYSTDGLFIQPSDAGLGELLETSKWHTPFIRYLNGVMCNGADDKPTDASDCRKANSTEKERSYTITIRCTQQKKEIEVNSISFKPNFLNIFQFKL